VSRRRAIPAEYVVPTRMTVDAQTWDWLVNEIENPGEPTPALVELVQRKRDDVHVEVSELPRSEDESN
jgi:hypothetical protein